jgi:hypothetical protein
MPVYLNPHQGLARRGDKRRVSATEFSDKTLSQDQDITVWTKEISNDKIAWWGHGNDSRDTADAFFDLMLEASGNGSGTDGDNITDGELVVAVMDNDERSVLARRTVGDLQDLRDAASENRSDKPIMEALAPYARPGRKIAVRIRAGSGPDGKELDSADCSGTLYYSETVQ